MRIQPGRRLIFVHEMRVKEEEEDEQRYMGEEVHLFSGFCFLGEARGKVCRVRDGLRSLNNVPNSSGLRGRVIRKETHLK